MIDENLPSPGLIPTGARLRTLTARTISYVETMASLKGGTTEQAQTLTAFFTACNAAIASFRDVALPTFVSGTASVAADPKRVVLTYSEGLDQTVLPAPGSWVLSQGGAVTAVEIVGATVILTCTVNLTAGAKTVTYTKPAANGLRDPSQNQVATHSASAFTVLA